MIAREWPVISASAFIMILMVIMTASLGYVFEHEAQPEKFDNIPNSVYWAVITLASVGYGDISPITPIGRFMTVVMALLGIGIFAIPAALLSSAFSDELHKEREELKNTLYKMMEDGVIDADEVQVIRSEARRMHLSIGEVNSLLKKIQQELDKESDTAGMPISQIAQRSELAVEHYKSLISEIRSLALLTDQAAFDATVKARDSLSASDLALWRQIQGKS